MKFGEKLQMSRNECGLTQQELADKAGVALKTIKNYESGKTYPKTRDVYSKLADALSIKIEFLYNENEEFFDDARKKYGYRGKKQAENLIEEVGALFAGGELSDEDKDGVMRAIQEFYWMSKEKNTKYGRKKNNDE